jgi:hypothetical protein
MRLAILILVALASAPAAAAPCRMGTNMPAIDANPAKPIDPNQARMVCTESVLVTRAPDGSEQRTRMWSFDLKK